MSQFCTSCGKAVPAGSPFCTECGARQPSAPAAPAPVVAQPQAATKGSPVFKILVVVFGVIALGTIIAMGSCFYIAYRLKNKARQYSAVLNSLPSSSEPSSAPARASNLPDLSDAMSKLGESLEKPASPLHVSFKKSSSDGSSYSLEADVSPDSIAGQETDVTPQNGAGSTAATTAFPRNATGVGTPEWTATVGAIEMAYLNSTMNGIRDAQAGLKYAGDEQAGGFDARRYDFDLATAPASAKLPTLMAGKWLGAVTSGVTGKRVMLKDYNVKGSAWLAKNDGRMVKFQYDYISIFDNGTQNVTHYEGLVTRK